LTNQLVVRMMQSVVDRGTGRRLRGTYGLTGQMAGKTGTTQNHSDGWFIGYTPDIVAGVWVGGASPKVRFRSLNLGAGGNMALPIWGGFMERSIKNKDFTDWQSEPYLEEMPLFVDLEDKIEDIGSDFEKKIESFFEELFEKDKKKTTQKRGNTRTKQAEGRSSRSEEIRKRNEKIKKQKERKEKRKNFFKKIFGEG